jgi:predicted cation transporter
MHPAVALALIGLLLLGPLVSHVIERNIEAYFFVMGVAAMTLGGAWSLKAIGEAAMEPVWITLAVIVAGVAFDSLRGAMDRAMTRLRARVARPLLCAAAVFVIAMVSSLITAIVAALVLVETVGLMRLEGRARARVTIAGCFAIGFGAALTPLGEPLSTLAARALGLGFGGLFRLLALWVVPAIVISAAVSAVFAARSRADGPAPAVVLARAHVRESLAASLLQGFKVYVFVAALVLVSHAFAPLALRYVPMLSHEALFWANTISAVMDNATLVALEIHSMELARARAAILALLVAGGMLIPGNVPNIIAAGALRIGAGEWAKVGMPMGLALLGLYFALLKFTH